MKTAIILISVLTLLVASFGVAFLVKGTDVEGELARGFWRKSRTGASVEIAGFWRRPATGASVEIAGFWRAPSPAA
jgi:hypothetical protein